MALQLDLWLHSIDPGYFSFLKQKKGNVDYKAGLQYDL